MIRLAKRDELERVNELRRQVHELHCRNRPDIFQPDFGEELARRVYELYGREDADVFVAGRDGALCGFATVNYVVKPRSAYNLERRIYHIEEFGVDESFRRMGVATELVAFLRRQAAEKGYPTIELDVWEFNDDALAFYEAAGFKAYRRFLELTV